ncbi:MAG: T9SS type A sorting domain-containing protein, partial [Ignavibacteriaceae bacterium]|nr:T9SS type A sorting domain-containing protein [Ignavibacteriaceae bacterium]
NPFYAWDINHREYAILVNSPYDALNAIPGTAGPLNALATWVLVFYGTHYTQGDMVEVDYANPARIGIDEFTFTPHSVTGVKENTIVPLNFNLSQNYPNPFNPSTVINYSIPRAGLVSLKIYDILGREIRTLLNENKTPGNYSVNFNAHGLSSGVYFYRLTMGTYSDVKKLMLLK